MAGKPNCLIVCSSSPQGTTTLLLFFFKRTTNVHQQLFLILVSLMFLLLRLVIRCFFQFYCGFSLSFFCHSSVFYFFCRGFCAVIHSCIYSNSFSIQCTNSYPQSELNFLTLHSLFLEPPTTEKDGDIALISHHVQEVFSSRFPVSYKPPQSLKYPIPSTAWGGKDIS